MELEALRKGLDEYIGSPEQLEREKGLDEQAEHYCSNAIGFFGDKGDVEAFYLFLNDWAARAVRLYKETQL